MSLILVSFIAIYIVAVFGASRFVVPHLGFRPDRIPDKIPPDMLTEINRLKKESASAAQFLELSWGFIGGRYRTGRLNTIAKFGYLYKSVEDVWGARGYLPCTQSNFLLRIFLVRSGYFTEADVDTRHIFFNFILHQYLCVRLNDYWLDVDVGEKQRGMKLGEHLKWFG